MQQKYKTKELLKCDFCGKLFFRLKSVIKQRKEHSAKHNFCSRKCFNEWDKKVSALKRIEEKVSCDFCEKRFYKPPSAKKRSRHNFCSKECEMRFKVNPDLTPSKELFYIIGVIYSDGWTSFKEKKYYRIGLSVIDEEYAQEFFRCLKKIGLNPHLTEGKKKSKFSERYFYTVMCHSIFLVKWLNKLKQSFLLKARKEHQIYFIRGIFDGDGSLNKKSIYYRAGISQKDRNNVLLMKKIVEGLGFKTSITENNLGMFNLSVLGGAKEVKRFIGIIKPVIPRKNF